MRKRDLAGLVVAATSALALPGAYATAATKQPVSNPNADSLDLVLGLIRDQGALRSRVKRVANPNSKLYRRYLTVDRIQRRYGANRDVKRSVRRYFAARGLPVRFDAVGASATVRMTRAQAERIFRTRLRARIAAGGRVARSAAKVPTVPSALHSSVSEVVGLDTTSVPQPQARVPGTAGPSGFVPPPGLPKRTGTPRGCPEGQASGAFMPNQIAAAHGYAPMHKRNIRGQGRKVALIEFAGGFNHSDMDIWAQCFGRDASNVRAKRVGIAEPFSSDTGASVEVALDIQVLLGMAPRLRRIDVYEGPDDYSFSQMIAAVLDHRVSGSSILPDVISISYGECEPGLGVGGLSDLRLTRYMLLAAAAAGVPVVVASGDTGSSGCYREDPAITQPFTSYPSTMSFATAVGGSSFRLKVDNTIADERVWNDTVYGVAPEMSGGGGGGQSIFERRPYFQPKLNKKTKGRGARVVPDLAMYAQEGPGWVIYCTATKNDCKQFNGFGPVGGTSAAAPAFAAGIALANQYAAKRGIPKVGFVNPLLYELGGPKSDIIRDIHLGTNDIFGVKCCSAKRGFDAASGWGSMRIDEFVLAAARAWRQSAASR